MFEHLNAVWKNVYSIVAVGFGPFKGKRRFLLSFVSFLGATNGPSSRLAPGALNWNSFNFSSMVGLPPEVEVVERQR
jgi:hypothetical protein